MHPRSLGAYTGALPGCTVAGAPYTVMLVAGIVLAPALLSLRRSSRTTSGFQYTLRVRVGPATVVGSSGSWSSIWLSTRSGATVAGSLGSLVVAVAVGAVARRLRYQTTPAAMLAMPAATASWLVVEAMEQSKQRTRSPRRDP